MQQICKRNLARWHEINLNQMAYCEKQFWDLVHIYNLVFLSKTSCGLCHCWYYLLVHFHTTACILWTLHPDSCKAWPSQIIFSLWKQTRAIDSSSQQVEEPCSRPVSKIVNIYRHEGLNRLCETDLGRWRVLDSIGEEGDPHTKDQTETLGLFWGHTRQTHTHGHTHMHVGEEFENALMWMLSLILFLVTLLLSLWTSKAGLSGISGIPRALFTLFLHGDTGHNDNTALSVYRVRSPSVSFSLSLPPLSALLPLNCDVPKIC